MDSATLLNSGMHTPRVSYEGSRVRFKYTQKVRCLDAQEVHNGQVTSKMWFSSFTIDSLGPMVNSFQLKAASNFFKFFHWGEILEQKLS